MPYDDDALRQIRERTNIVEFIGQYVQLKKSGRTYSGLSPFRTERTPSFHVWPETQTWRDFGANEGGDIFKFVMKMENMDFGEAKRLLAERAGVTLTPRNERKTSTEAEERRERLLQLNETAALFFHHMLMIAPPGQPGRAYMEKRGIAKEIAEQFQLGYAPDDWEALTRYLRSKGANLDEALEIGLLSQREGGRGPYDRFRGRFIFPIRDRTGRVVGFGGRSLADDQMPKYLNTPQSPLFDKSHLLYAIDQAADAIRKAQEVVIVEGYVDALTAHQFGYRNVVATMGTALTEQQVGLVKKLAPRIILALDADAAGQLAMLRAVDTLRNALGDDAEYTVDARGLVRSQRRASVAISILTVPSGKDPDEFIRSDPHAWPKLVGEAQPVLDYVIRSVVAAGDAHTGTGKSAIIRKLAPIIPELADRVERGVYISMLARMLGVSEQYIESALRQQSRAATRPIPEAEQARRLGPTRTQYLLSLLVRYPDAMPDVLEHLPDEAAEIFVDTAERTVWDTLVALAQDESQYLDTEAVYEQCPEELREHLDMLQQMTEDREWYTGRVAAEANALLSALLIDHARRRIDELKDVLATAQSESDDEVTRFCQAEIARMTDLLRFFYPPPSTVFRDLRSPRR
jgi:DNA primase